MNENPKHRAIAKIIVFSLIAIFVVFMCTRENEVPPTPRYSIFNQDLSDEQNTFRVETPSIYNESKLNLVAREIKVQWSLQGSEQAYFFYVPVNHESPYASVAYLPKCETCGKNVDVDGEKYEVSYLR